MKQPNMQSFDLLLCSGNGKMSKRIRWAQKVMGYSEAEANITHLALATFGDDWVFESTTLNEWCHTRGVQVGEFYKWKHHYQGKIWLRHIEVKRTPEIYLSGFDKSNSLLGRPYESGIPGYLELFRCILPDWMPTKRTWELHCTEAVGEVLQEIGWLKKFRNVGKETDWGYQREQVRLNKLPPAKWWKQIDSLMTVRVGEPIQIKG